MKNALRIGWIFVVFIILASCSSGLTVEENTDSMPDAQQQSDQTILDEKSKLNLTPDMVLYNAQIYTMDTNLPEVDAIAIRGDRIIGIGENKEILSAVSDQTRIIDLQGQAVFPGFIDGHSHRITQRYNWDLDTIEQAAREAMSLGWTGVTELAVDENQIQEMIAADSEGSLPIRINAYLIVNSFEGEPLGDWYQQYRPGQVFSPNLRIAGLKIFIDFDSGRTLFWDQDALNEFVCQRQAEGWQITVKAISIQSHELALDAYESCLGNEPLSASRFRIEHSVSVTDDQISRMAQNGIIASIQPSFPSVIWNEEDIRNLSREQGPDNLFRWREYANKGVFLVSSPYNPPPGFDEYYSDSHLSVAGLIYRSLTQMGINDTVPQEWMLDRALTLEELIPTLTINGAFATFEEQEKGSLSPGKLADLVVFSMDPFNVAPQDLLQLRVVMTLVGGQIEFCRPGSEEFCPGSIKPAPANFNQAVGTWQAIDIDGSHMRLNIDQNPDGSFSILLFDDQALFCQTENSSDENNELWLTGQAFAENLDLIIPHALAQCPSSTKQAGLEFSLYYDPSLGTLTDSTGIVWSRTE